MPTTVEIMLPTGESPVLTLYPLDAAVAANPGGDVLTEIAGKPHFYRATVAESLAGVYHAIATVSGTPLGTGYVNMQDGELCIVRAEPPTDTTVIDAVLADVDISGDTPPAEPANIQEMLGHLYKNLIRKRDQSAAQQRIYNAAGDTVELVREVTHVDGVTTIGPMESP